MPFAEGTTVPVEKSRAEIEQIVTRYGATKFSSGWDGDTAAIMFAASNRVVKFVLRLPTIEEMKAADEKRRKAARIRLAPATADKLAKMQMEESRRRWRALALVIKGRLEAVESGIESFDVAFMAHLMLPNKRTVSDEVLPKLEQAYGTNTMPKLLTGIGE